MFYILCILKGASGGKGVSEEYVSDSGSERESLTIIDSKCPSNESVDSIHSCVLPTCDLGLVGLLYLLLLFSIVFLWNTGGFIVIGIYFNKQEKTVLMTLHVLDRHIKAVICVLRWSVYFWLVICHMCTKEFYYLLQLVKIIIYKLLNLCIIRIIQIQNKINMLLCTHSLLSVFLL